MTAKLFYTNILSFYLLLYMYQSDTSNVKLFWINQIQHLLTFWLT